MKAARPVADRFWEKVEKGDGCWLWTGARSRRNGYGFFRVSTHAPDGSRFAHRVAYELTVGPIPDGLQIDHLCRNTGCVRPDHLEAVEPRTNTLRGTAPAAINAAKQTCLRGHPFSDIDSRGQWYCRACHNESNREYRLRGKARNV